MILTMFTFLAYLLLSSVSVQGNCGALEAATNLKAEKTTNISTHLSWDPPASTECADHYEIAYCAYLDADSQDCANKTVVLPLNSTQYDITELKPCNENLVQFYTVGTDGSEITTELILYTGSGDPPKLDNVKLGFVGATNITVEWALPRGYSDQCYPGFRLCYSAKGDSQETCTYTIYEEFDTDDIAPLSPCTEYKFSVVTVDGNFAADSKTSEKTYTSVVTAPQMPNITADVRNHTGHVTWEAPEALSMTCAASYLVKNCLYTDDTDPFDCTTVFSETLPVNSTGAIIKDLAECTYNYVSVALVGHDGYSTSNKAVAFDEDSDIPKPSHVTITHATTSQFTLNFYKENAECVTSYRTCWFTKDEEETCKVRDISYPTVFTNLHLKPCSDYSLHFTALGKGGKHSENLTLAFQTGPDNVLNQTIEPSLHSALISWHTTPSALQCGTSYGITWEGFDSPLHHSVTLPLNATSYNITGLEMCTDYTVRFSTNGINGTTSGENDNWFTTKLGDVGPITSFQFYSYGDIYYMHVDYPDNSRNCLSSSVTCWYEIGGSQAQKQCEEYKTSWDANSLKTCVNYTITVTATMKNNKTTSGSTIFSPGPANVANLRLEENASARSVKLTWSNLPSNSLCVQYIQVTTTKLSDNKWTQVELPSNATTTTVTDLSPCTTYSFAVQPMASSAEIIRGFSVQYTTSCSDAMSSS